LGNPVQTLTSVINSLHFYFWTFLAKLYHWQTLFAGLFALAGAGWTVKGIRGQITQATQLRNDELLRKERAARVVLPLALSELTQYCIDCMKLLAPYVHADSGTPRFPPDMKAPRLPENILEPMQACTRFADLNVAAQIHSVLAWLQIQHSHLEGLISKATNRTPQHICVVEGVKAITDAAELHAHCAGLYHYARDTKPDPKMTFQDNLQSALFLVGIVAVDHPGLSAAIANRPSPHTIGSP
jgi:hypothetical protein